jgi:hypothetical protein
MNGIVIASLIRTGKHENAVLWVELDGFRGRRKRHQQRQRKPQPCDQAYRCFHIHIALPAALPGGRMP